MGKRNGPVWPRLQLSCPRAKGSADSGLATLGAVLGKLSQDHLGVASLKGNFSRLRTKEDPEQFGKFFTSPGGDLSISAAAETGLAIFAAANPIAPNKFVLRKIRRFMSV